MVLAVVPWLYDQGGATVEEIGEQFSLPEDEVLAVLSAVQCCEIPPYGGATLGITVMDDGEVVVDPTVALERPLRFTADEAFGLLVATQAARSLPGVASDGALSRAIEKLEQTLGTQDQLNVDLGESSNLDLLKDALNQQLSIEGSYYVAYRDEMTQRHIDPIQVYGKEGNWYLVGYCHSAEAQRTFRVDRFVDLRLSDPVSLARDADYGSEGFIPDDAVQRVRLRMPSRDRWVVERMLVEDLDDSSDGVIEVTLPVTGEVWLEQLLLRLGPEAVVLDPPELRDVGRDAAARLLNKYV